MSASISGNAGIAGATVVLVGYASNTALTTTADGSGNYSFAALNNDTYHINPALAGQVFSPYTSQQIISGLNITGVNFIATPFIPTGVWTKYGDINLITPASTQGSFLGGTQPGAVLLEGAPRLISAPASGLVFKTWYMDGLNVRYAESVDGQAWTIKSGNIVANALWPTIFKNNGTYYLYVIPSGGTSLSVYTATDGVTFTLQQAAALSPGGAGTWDAAGIYQVTPIDNIAGTWNALYTGFANVNSLAVGAIGLATSTDLIHWTKANSSNPVILNGSAQCPIKIGGTYYVWLNWVPYDQSAGFPEALGEPSDIWRLQSTDLLNWTNAIPSLPRSFIGEGVNNFDGQTGNCWLVPGSTSVYIFYMGTNRGGGNAGLTATNFKFMLATAGVGIQQLVQTNEGIKASSQLAVDTFNRADENPLSDGGKWTTVVNSFGGLRLVSKAAQPIAINTWGLQVFDGGIVWPNDQYTEVVLAANNTGATRQNIHIIRTTSGASGANNYQLTIFGTLGISQTVDVFSTTNGSSVLIASFTATPNVGDTWRMQAIGSTIKIYQNGVLVQTVIDTNWVSGKPGLQAFNSSATADTAFSAWEGGMSAPWAGGNANVIPMYGGGAGTTGDMLIDNRLCTRLWG
jgi:hypothetical protein